MPSHEFRQRRKERGLCTVCGKRPLVTISYCEECRISENNYKKTRWNVRHKEAKGQGKCTTCFYNPPRAGMATCIECSQESKRYHQKLKAQGKCLRCCRRNDGSGIYCIQCNKEKNDRAAQKEYSRKRYEKAKGEGTCIYCHKLSAKDGKVGCIDCTKTAIKQGIVNGWINLFNLYLEMRGKCAVCGNTDLRMLIIDHMEYYNHHTGDNGRIWNKRKLRARQSAETRAEILQEHSDGKLQLLCANCNRLKELKRIGCDPYIQDALDNKYSGSWNQRTYGWINKFNLLKGMGGKCFKCGLSELAALEIHHTELFHHSKNGLKWKKIQTTLRRNNGVRAEILQRYRAGSYLLLCCNCNKLEAHKQVRSEPYIQQALIKLNKLNTNNNVKNTFVNNSHDSIWQIIILNIVVCLVYLFILVWFYRYTKFDVL